MRIRSWRQFLNEEGQANYADSRLAWVVHRIADADGYLMVAGILAQAKKAIKMNRESGWSGAWNYALHNVVVDTDDAADAFLQDGGLPRHGRIEPGVLAGDGALYTATKAELNRIGKMVKRVADQAEAMRPKTNTKGTEVEGLRRLLRQAIAAIPQIDDKEMMSGIEGAGPLDGESGWRGLTQAILDYDNHPDRQDVIDNANSAAEIVADGDKQAADRVFQKFQTSWGRPFSEVDFGDVWIPNWQMHPSAKAAYDNWHSRAQGEH